MADVQEIAAYCLTKPAATKAEWDDDYLIGNWELTQFARLQLDKTVPILTVRCRDSVLAEMKKAGIQLKKSKVFHWEKNADWEWKDIANAASIPEAYLRRLIDDSYQVAYDALFDFQKKQVELLARKAKPQNAFDELIDRHQLTRQKSVIERLAVPSVRMHATAVTEAKLRLGQSKIGGQPDLPTGVEWPCFRDGRPLAFLCQLNLDELPPGFKTPLPVAGVLSFFSVFGWQSEDGSDPALPPGPDDETWTRVLHFENKELSRRRSPKSPFPSAKVEFSEVRRFPHDSREIEVVRQKWNVEVQRRYLDFVSDLQEAERLLSGKPDRTFLFGYADYQQDFVPEVAERDYRLLLQLGSVDASHMMWGDGGDLYFWLPRKNLATGRFENVWVDCQGG